MTPKTWTPDQGFEAGMEMLDGPTEVAVDRVPTMDQASPIATAPPDWTHADTRVISCAIANSVYPGERFETRQEAVAAITARHGRILEANYVPGRAFFRVARIPAVKAG